MSQRRFACNGLRSNNPRTLKNDPTRKEKRQRQMKITPEQIRQMEKILENEGLEGRSLTWMYLGFEAQAEASEATIRRAMYGYVRWTITNASPVNEVGSRLQVRRTEYNLRKELTLSHPKDWDRVRFSKEVPPYTLDGGLHLNSESSASLENATVLIAFFRS